MANFRAPGIKITEVDVSEVTTPAGTSVGALVGPAYKGPTNRRVLITSDKQFNTTFGTPISGTASEYHFYAAQEFMKESGFMWYVRSTGANDYVGAITVTNTSATSAQFTATSAAEGTTSNLLAIAGYEDGNKTDKYYPAETSGASTDLYVSALGAGDYSKDIAISIVTSADLAATSGINFAYGYNWAGKYPTDYQYYRINVYTKEDKTTASEAGWVTGAPAISAVTPDETYIVSNNPLAKDYDGNSMYVKDVINGKSSTIYVNTDGTDLTESFTGAGINQLGTGVVSIASSDIVGGWDLFSSKEAVSPNLLIAPYDPVTLSAANVAACTVANTRRDCFAVTGIGSVTATKVTEIADLKSSSSSYSTSYVGLYAGGDLIFDKYSSKNVYVPKSVFAASIIARNDNVANPWDAPAGLNRGGLSSLGQYKVFNESEIGYLYNYNINTSKRIRSSGDYIWGQKTGQTKASALDRINVRRLLLYIENSIEPMLQSYLFELNNERTRSRVSANLNSFLQTIYAGGGLIDYQVVVDDTNNTPQVIDNNELAIDLYIQPAKSIEFINVKVTITRTGVSFAEVV